MVPLMPAPLCRIPAGNQCLGLLRSQQHMDSEYKALKRPKTCMFHPALCLLICFLFSTYFQVLILQGLLINNQMKQKLRFFLQYCGQRTKGQEETLISLQPEYSKCSLSVPTKVVISVWSILELDLISSHLFFHRRNGSSLPWSGWGAESFPTKWLKQLGAFVSTYFALQT